jgi:hypothetical protein
MHPALILSASLMLAFAAWAEPVDHAGHSPAEHHHAHAPVPPAATAERELVSFPPRLKEDTLANMRDHLLAIQEITAYLAERKFDAAADTAETRLGMSSLQRHGAHEVAQYMPAGMREIGHGMHQAASRFATAAADAGATGEVGPALRALSHMQASCVACHAAYQLK